jgi:hypothetical protein
VGSAHKATESPIITGDNQPTTDATELPASPSRDNTAAAVQLGAAAAIPNAAPSALIVLFLGFTRTVARQAEFRDHQPRCAGRWIA